MNLEEWHGWWKNRGYEISVTEWNALGWEDHVVHLENGHMIYRKGDDKKIIWESDTNEGRCSPDEIETNGDTIHLRDGDLMVSLTF